MSVHEIKDRFVIAIDATNIRQGGGQTHLIELLNSGRPVRDGFSEVCVWGSRNTLRKLPNYSWLKKEWSPALDGNLLRRTLWQKFFLAGAARNLNCDVLFVPGGSHSTSFRPVVTMSQNMLPFEWREISRYGFSLLTLKLAMLRFTQALSFRRAEGVIFLTNYAQQGILQVTGPLSGMTRVIPHGLNARFLISDDDFAQQKSLAKGGPIRLIYVSIIDQYKHQWHVVEGVAKARKSSGLDLHLDLIGPLCESVHKRLNAAIAEQDPRGEWVNYRGVVEYDELHSFYAKAQVGIFASSCENMPNILLEMMGAGLPLLSSDRGPMPEILGNAGLYFDPEKPDTLCAVLLELLASDEKMRMLAHAAHKKAKVFSWERCAADTFGFLRHVADSYR